jgi:hypothetical protein
MTDTRRIWNQYPFGPLGDLRRGIQVDGAVLCPNCLGISAFRGRLHCEECGDRGWLADDGPSAANLMRDFDRAIDAIRKA